MPSASRRVKPDARADHYETAADSVAANDVTAQSDLSSSNRPKGAARR